MSEIPPYPAIKSGSKIMLTDGRSGTVKEVRGWGGMSQIHITPDNPESALICVKPDKVKALDDAQGRVQIDAIKKLLSKEWIPTKGIS